MRTRVFGVCCSSVENCEQIVLLLLLSFNMYIVQECTSFTVCNKSSNIVTVECVFFERDDDENDYDYDDNVDDDGITTKNFFVCFYIFAETESSGSAHSFWLFYIRFLLLFVLLLPPFLAIPNLDAKFCHSWFLD